MSLALQMIGEQLAAAMPPGAMLRMDGDRHVRCDATVATAFTARELEHVKAQTYDVKKVALKARTLIPVSFEAHPGAEVISYDQYDGKGEAAVVENYSRDFPRVDAEKRNFGAKVFGIGDSYGYTIQDLRAIAMSGSKLNAARAMQARRAIEAKLERIACRGIPAIGRPGFATEGNVPLLGTAFNWTMNTPAQTIKRQLGALVQSVVTQSSDVWQPDTLVMPTDAYAIASEVSFGVDNGRSVLAVFLAENAYIRQVEQWTQLDDAGAAAGQGRIVCYKRVPEVLELEISQDYEETPPEVRGMEFVIHGHLRTAGTVIRYPMAMAYADGTFDAASLS